MVKVEVTDKTSERFPAKLAVFLFVGSFEDRALIPGRPFIFFERLAEIVLRDVHDANLEHLVSFGVCHQVMKPWPGPFQFLKIFVVDHKIDLFRQLLIDFSDNRFNAFQHVIRNERGILQGLFGERANGPRHGFLGFIGFGLKFTIEKLRKFTGFDRTGRRLLSKLFFGHGRVLLGSWSFRGRRFWSVSKRL